MAAKRASEMPKSQGVFGQRRKSPKTFRAGLYARVSTNDQQTLPMQNRAMREYALRRGWTIAMQVREVGCGASQRQAREQLLEAARRREIDILLVWRLDRWGRSVTDLLATLQELDHLGVGFASLTEALDLTTPAGRAMAGVLTFASDELTGRLRIVPRPGEPPVYRFTLDDLDELAGYVAAEANHAQVKKLEIELNRLYARIAVILESYTDEGDASTR